MGRTFTAKPVSFDVNYFIQIQLLCHAPVAHKLFSHKQMKDYFRGEPLTSGDMSQITVLERRRRRNLYRIIES